MAAPLSCDPRAAGVLAAVRALYHSRAEGCAALVLCPTRGAAAVAHAAYAAVFGDAAGLLPPRAAVGAGLRCIRAVRLLVASAEDAEVLCRRWRRELDGVALLVAEGLERLGGCGAPLEVCVSRFRRRRANGRPLRIVGVCAPVQCAGDLASWLGVSAQNAFAFGPAAAGHRPEVRTFGAETDAQLLRQSLRPLLSLLRSLPRRHRAILAVPSAAHAPRLAVDLLSAGRANGALGDGAAGQWASAALGACAAGGVGFLTPGLAPRDRAAVLEAFEAGAVRALVAPAAEALPLGARAEVAVLLGARGERGLPLAGADLHGLAGLASEASYVFARRSDAERARRLLGDALPVESALDQWLGEHLNAAVVGGEVGGAEEAVDWLTWTFLYRRVLKNPNYYGLSSRDPQIFAEFLSQSVEEAVEELEAIGCLRSAGPALEALNLGRVAAHHGVRTATVELFASSAAPSTKLRGALLILSSAAEIDDLPIARHAGLAALCRHIPVALPPSAPTAARLLALRISRAPLTAAMREDARSVAEEAPRLLRALVDVAASAGMLRPALAALELLQCVAAGQWQRESELLQIPHFDAERCERAEGLKIEAVLDVLECAEEDRERALEGLSDAQVAEVADFCNAFPSLDVSYSLAEPGDVFAGDVAALDLSLAREEPGEPEQWYAVVGAKGALLGIKRVEVSDEKALRMEFAVPEEVGKQQVTLYLMHTEVLGADQEFQVELDVREGEEEEEDEG